MLRFPCITRASGRSLQVYYEWAKPKIQVVAINSHPRSVYVSNFVQQQALSRVQFGGVSGLYRPVHAPNSAEMASVITGYVVFIRPTT